MAEAETNLAEPGRIGKALERDFAVACRIMYRPDFLEGLRAVLVDKDNAPKWQPASQAEASQAEIASVLEPLPESDRRLGLVETKKRIQCDLPESCALG